MTKSRVNYATSELLSRRRADFYSLVFFNDFNVKRVVTKLIPPKANGWVETSRACWVLPLGHTQRWTRAGTVVHWGRACQRIESAINERQRPAKDTPHSRQRGPYDLKRLPACG
jgi:hypothetical protein